MCFHVGDDERSQGTWCAPRRFSHSGRRRSSLRRNESWCAPMLVQRKLTMERHNVLGFLLGYFRIVVDTNPRCDVMSLGVILCWYNVDGI